MPQLIAMIIVIVVATLYMFQTFGGTGDKIEGIAKKTTVVTEINNIKLGIRESLERYIRATDSTVAGKVNTLEGLAEKEVFDKTINVQLDADGKTKTNTVNTYKAISYGADNSLEITLVLPTKTQATSTARPGLYVDMSQGSLAGVAGFLEQQITQDLGSLCAIDTHATSATYKPLESDGDIVTPTTAGTNTDKDGKFVLYCKDLPNGLIDND
ncbi:MAG: hypothetical protein RBR23_03210 [Arcobacteraceae bacterium]|jgi:hypothetical protein|nr:hypothetical protein [Arcobacteraceae bacterium]